jgi:tetratricopeptide (TPR) repeat protein
VREAAARAAGDLAEVTRALAYQLQMSCRQNRLAEVVPLLGELQQLGQQGDLPPDVRFEVAYTLALYWTMCEQYDQAIHVWEHTLPLARELSVRAFAVNRGWLAICHYRRGAVEQAEALWTAVLHDAASGGFHRGVVSSEVGLARIALDRGNAVEAYALLTAAEHAAHAYGDRGLVAEIQLLLARYYRLRGEAAAAREMLMAAQDTYERLGLARELAAVGQMLLAEASYTS